MTDPTKTLAWLADLSQMVFDEARKGNTVPANRIMGANPALAHYLNNVAATKAVAPQSWALAYPQFLAEADRVRLEYEAQEAQAQNTQRISALEGSIGEIKAMLVKLVESDENSAADVTVETPATPATPARPDPKKPKAPDKAEEAPAADATTDETPESEA